MAENVLLKDLLFHPAKVKHLAGQLRQAWPAFRKDAFVRDVVNKFPELELKARISWIAACLRKHLPEEYREAVTIILKALPAPNDPHLSDNDFGDFIYAPYSEFVARYGCQKAHLNVSFRALHEITRRFSAEDAIRYFINAFPDETLAKLALWSRDDHYHVRRLASEGTRPKLPWSQKLNIPVHSALPILDQLHADTTRFVTRSVANHLNDISKVDPDLVIDTLSRWRVAGLQRPDEMDYIVRHAMRTLIKKGHPRAMEMLGAPPDPQIRVRKFRVPKEVSMQTPLELSCTVEADEDVHLIIDYILHFQNKSGELKGRKVFKWKTCTLRQGETLSIARRHMLRENMTTRKLYRGRHRVEVQINGRVYGGNYFSLV